MFVVGECTLILLLPKIWDPSFYIYVLDAISRSRAFCLFKNFLFQSTINCFDLELSPPGPTQKLAGSFPPHLPLSEQPPTPPVARPATELQSSGLPRGAAHPLPAARAALPDWLRPGVRSRYPAERRMREAVRQRSPKCFPNRHCVVSPSSLPGLCCLGLPLSRAERAAAPAIPSSLGAVTTRQPVCQSVHPFWHWAHPPALVPTDTLSTCRRFLCARKQAKESEVH